LLSSCQKNSPGVRHFETFSNNKSFFTVSFGSPTPNPQAGGPPLVGYPQLLIQYIRIYLP